MATIPPKYTAGGRCVACTRMSSARQQNKEYKGNNRAARANIQRAIASMDMKKTYEPTRPCKHGHLLRYVSSNNCVECSINTAKNRREKAKDERLVRLYGITSAEREVMAENQSFKCAICKEQFADNRSMHVDHCHSSGAVRSLLCSPCNQGIGLLKEDPAIIRAAADYVEFHAARLAA